MSQIRRSPFIFALVFQTAISQTADRPRHYVDHFFLWFRMPAINTRAGVTSYSTDDIPSDYDNLREWLENIGAASLHKIYPEYLNGDTIRTTGEGKRVRIRDLSQRFVVQLEDSIEWKSILHPHAKPRLVQIRPTPFDLGILLRLKGLQFRAEPGILSIPLEWAETELQYDQTKTQTDGGSFFQQAWDFRGQLVQQNTGLNIISARLREFFLKYHPLIIRRWPGMEFGKAEFVEKNIRSFKLYFDDGVNLTDVFEELKSIPGILYVSDPNERVFEDMELENE